MDYPTCALVCICFVTVGKLIELLGYENCFLVLLSGLSFLWLFSPMRLGIELTASWVGLWLIHGSLIMYLRRASLGLCLLDCELVKFVHFSPHIWKVLPIFIFFETFVTYSVWLMIAHKWVKFFYFFLILSLLVPLFEISFFIVTMFSCRWPSLFFVCFKLFLSLSNNVWVFTFIIWLLILFISLLIFWFSCVSGQFHALPPISSSPFPLSFLYRYFFLFSFSPVSSCPLSSCPLPYFPSILLPSAPLKIICRLVWTLFIAVLLP